jgi:hypothetical protein
MNFSCKILVNAPKLPLNLTVLLDDTAIFETKTDQPEYKISHDISNDKAEHSLKFIMSGKTDNHTIYDNNSEIVKTAQISICDISFDNTNVSDLFLSTSNLITYTHNHNGYTSEIVESLKSTMGCNGVAELKFSTPVYLWILNYM